MICWVRQLKHMFSQHLLVEQQHLKLMRLQQLEWTEKLLSCTWSCCRCGRLCGCRRICAQTGLLVLNLLRFVLLRLGLGLFFRLLLLLLLGLLCRWLLRHSVPAASIFADSGAVFL